MKFDLRFSRFGLAGALVLATSLTAVHPLLAQDDEGPTTISGEAILAHPGGKAVLAAAKLLREGKLAEVKSRSVQEVRDEWAAASAEERREDTKRAQQRAPDPEAFAAEIAKTGEMTFYGDTASLRIPTPDGNDVSAMAFVALEGGEWKVTGGPMTFAPAPVETAPAIEGAAILEHELGKLVLEYAKRLEAGAMGPVLELLSSSARAVRAERSPAEQAKSDEFRRGYLPGAAALGEQIRSGGRLYFTGETAGLSVVVNTSVKDGDTTTFTSTSTGVGFVLEGGVWKIAD